MSLRGPVTYGELALPSTFKIPRGGTYNRLQNILALALGARLGGLLALAVPFVRHRQYLGGGALRQTDMWVLVVWAWTTLGQAKIPADDSIAAYTGNFSPRSAFGEAR